MKRFLTGFVTGAAALAMMAPVVAQNADEAAQAEAPKTVDEVMAMAGEADWLAPDPDSTIYMLVPHGLIVIVLSDDLAPGHVEQVRTLVREGYYDGLNFYRVIDGFVAQGGDVSEEKDKGSAAESLPAEFEEPIPDGLAFTPLGNFDGYAPEAGFINGMPAGIDRERGSVWLAHCTGAFAFGRNNERDSASTEFYIALQPQRYLDRNLTVFGRVIWGMDVVQAIKRGRPNNGGVIENEEDWTPIISARLASDVPEAELLDLQMMDTNSDVFLELIEARRNRMGAFFYVQHDYLDLCQLQLPVRLKPVEEEEGESE
ncbi:peptidylprolyl isomerase [Aquisalinus flavus]|uniref:peptidylprolyl isomerase n=1 Tax=Aquisalinus flavus TaxID=1526572 RepID=A0A8J2V4E2_9PROT|nr:peptidylprolyl isomerase [Aquisalinus flavus]MBD0426537.1 peptidylprolyl isomerase [Aquisalinus flavus]GGD07168.1 peptidyl-prolyl cis-trans isomerase [Aquisalinus flavus]